ncbi:MAG: hypothetical protein NTV06_09280 [candidate division Zixibacteria bacterium]|nr:hypothetical protein [candidate division Zixibacteria bacterium]
MRKDILVYGAVGLAVAYLILFVPKPVAFSTNVSYIIIGLIFLALVYILVRTINGHFVGRRIVFLFVGIAVVLPFFMNVSQPIRVSPEVQIVYESVAQLKPGSKVLATFDYDPASAPELQPMAESFFRLCLERDLKIIIMGLWPQGPQQAELALQIALQDPAIVAKNLQRRVDYVNLGYQTGNEFVIQRMGTSFKSMFPRDVDGVPYDSIPLLKGVNNFSNIDYSFNLSAGVPGTVEWVQVAVDRYGLKVGAGNTGVQATGMYPYLRAGQLKGLLGGLSGAAEFERATGKTGSATFYMLPQSFSHVIVIAFIIIGNAAYFLGEKKKSKKEV